ncbi:hypothetical protein GCM10027413_30210 [Conyzicola nivalis]|uniref:DNA modification methylase n=1 Tax=Conyzicola nivalis TaxID=1477021 RepID=A0A916STI1_9MICO|nr:hypothetical protein [Conyzicola nivalis]GGB13040.1 hypothetical protein GCM10010979_29300 [Conyzicola nivalis]
MIARGAASAILIGGLLLGTTGCSLFSEKATLIQYEPSDGTAANLGDIELRNVLAISEDGETVNLVLTANNTSDEGIFVSFQYNDGAGEEQLYVAGNSSKSFGQPDEDSVILTDADVEIGGLMPLYAQYGDTPGKELLVPVFDGSLGEYSTLVPTEPTSTPTAEPTGTPSPTSTPAAE